MMMMMMIRHKEVRYTLPHPPHYSTHTLNNVTHYPCTLINVTHYPCTLNNVTHYSTSSLSSDTSQVGIVSTISEEIPMRVVKCSPTGTSCQWR